MTLCSTSLLIHIACERIIGSLQETIELIRVIAGHGSPKQWCSYLRINGSTCNQVDHSRQHPGDVIIDVTKAYLDQKLNPCWEEVIYILCKNLNKNKAAEELSEKYDVDYASVCG